MNTSTAQIQVTRPSPKKTHLTVRGSIDEFTIFPEIHEPGEVTIDLSGVTRLNSVGTRSWCIWIREFKAPTQVILVGCPAIVVKSFTSVEGVLTDRCRVYSFNIPFYSDETGEHLDFLAVWGQHFDSKGKLTLPPMKDSKGNPMELDVIEESYFSFLKT